MAGHSKWANIRHKKGRADAKKGKAFARATKEIINAVKQGGPDAKANPQLRLALQKAKAVNLPQENIERNIKKASSSDTTGYQEVTYELYGHGGVGLIVEVMTDNKNRTASDMRIATNKRGGSIADVGSVAFNFVRKGVMQIVADGVDAALLFEVVTEAGADDFEEGEGMIFIYTPPELTYQVKEAIEAKEFVPESCEISMLPKLFVECSEEQQQSNEALIEWLEELDDVDVVYHNMQL